MKMPWSGLMVGIVLCGCVATTPRIDAGRLDEVRRGRTSYAEIVQRFGTPSLVSRNPDGTQFATYVHAEPGADPKAVVPLVAGVMRDSVTFHFDARGMLTDVKTTARAESPSSPPPAAADGAAASGTPPAAAAPGSDRPKSGGWLWRLPDWLPAAPRENR
jgi:hypothetical protein